MKDTQHRDSKEMADDAANHTLRITERMKRDVLPRSGFTERTLYAIEQRRSTTRTSNPAFLPVWSLRLPRFAVAGVVVLAMLNITTLLITSRTTGQNTIRSEQGGDSYRMAMDDGSMMYGNGTMGGSFGERKHHEH